MTLIPHVFWKLETGKDVLIWGSASLPYSLITVKAIELENVSLKDVQNLKTVANTLTAKDKYSLVNKDSFNAIILHAITSKRKNFFSVFSAFYKFRLKFEKKGWPS